MLQVSLLPNPMTASISGGTKTGRNLFIPLLFLQLCTWKHLSPSTAHRH